MIARKVHSLTKKNKKVMIARKVHSLTKKQNKSHDCTKSSLFDQNKKTKNTFARKVPSLTKTTQNNMIVRKVHSLTTKTNVMIARKVVLYFVVNKMS